MTIYSHRPNRILLTLLTGFMFLSGTLCAQEKLSASLTGGLSFPSGRFANQVNIMPTGLSNVDGGAQTGWNGNLQFGAALTPVTWVTITVGLSGFKRDNESFEQILEMLYGETPVANAGSWKILKVLAGPSFRLPVGDKFTVRPSISAGIAKTSIPAFDYTIYAQGGDPQRIVRQAKIKLPATFAYQAGLGWGYKIGRQISLLADFNFFAARAKYEFSPTVAGTSPLPLTKYEYPLNAYSVSAGVEFSFK